MGDLPEVQLMCPYCKDPNSYSMDQYPRYEITKGAYLLSLRRYCLTCLSKSKTIFVLVDDSVMYRYLTSLICKYTEMQAKEHVPDALTHAYLEKMKEAELQAWLSAQALKETKTMVSTAPKGKLLSLAKSVYDYQSGPRDQEGKHRLKKGLNKHRSSPNPAKVPRTRHLANQRVLDRKGVLEQAIENRYSHSGQSGLFLSSRALTLPCSISVIVAF